MTRIESRIAHISNLLVGATGLVYGWMRYFCKPTGEFSIVNHPWQPHAQHWHILFAPLLVLVIGHLIYHHALVYWRAGMKEGRRSGLTLILMALPMILSGYLLQISVEPFWRNTWVIIHVAASLAWILCYVAHFFVHLFARKRNPCSHLA